MKLAPVEAPAGSTAPDLRIEGLVVRTPEGRTILSVERLHVPAGATLGIQGPSGAGKSTLLHAISGLIPVSAGRVMWGGTDLAALPEAARDAFRRRALGLIFQDFLLLEELSPLDNAAVAAAWAPRAERAAIRARAAELLSRFGAPIAARSVSGLSGGERQRIAAARALARDPAAILADEPTASLDRENADRLVADLLAAARERGRTVIAVSHDAAMMAAMDRVVQVVDGQVRQ
ncbi:ATP-binding cassette domain-containing protein [Albimonas sp. CAU 1670]|uniref:ATP-binding cassette domain-containing protein n=1 Tax=Albimonas sp. CAU 1670 TaxID=3032599 RepID=UPI0023D9FE28|nr:ATP-binding cassette domain-containing protein [Albimonas sp. CAU 1670]MDF2232905.1 ATP-binding cassette domain-containing protein [Albimonas sp. CAU 1670]